MQTDLALAPPTATTRRLGPAGLEILAAADRTELADLVPAPLADVIAEAVRALAQPRQQLLGSRRERQAAWDAGALPGPLAAGELPQARGSWNVAALPLDLLRRRVEITGPVNDAKMVINMLSRGADGTRADAAMLDFEDSMKPSWDNVVAGIANVRGAARGDLEHLQRGPGGTKHYRLDPDDRPLVMVRVRGLHLDESNLLVDGQPVPAGLFDLAASAYHAAATLVSQGRTPMIYVPKVEHHLEARWWESAFTLVEQGLGLRAGTLRATLLIETLPAAFQMEEILWELRRRIAALNVGRWDKIFSDIKCLAEHADRVLADRATIGLNRPWMRHYAERLVEICHRHGALAIGGMAAFTPGRSAERRAEQTAKVVADKRFEAELGHDGCWVSHPYFIGPALSAFGQDNQLDVRRPGADQLPLLPEGGGPRTLAGLRTNARVGIAYVEGWLRDSGCIAWDDLMEDLATLEISRAQTWQWLRHGVRLDDGPEVSHELVARVFDEELEKIATELRSDDLEVDLRPWQRAKAAAEQIFTAPRLVPFLSRVSDPAGLDLDHRLEHLLAPFR
jgi:malate synthase